jgi:UDP-N-acetylmuramoyl-L-alanyl-D-glutamate--2,6-diaminopimelate ligase
MGMVGGPLVDNPNTTPDAIVLHRTFAESLAAGADSVAMEVSSIGLDQGRVAGVAFDLAVFTNLTRDHLDYHGDMAHYAHVKAQLFALPSLAAVIVNLDDPLAQRILEGVPVSAENPVRRIGYTVDRERAQSSSAARHLDAMFTVDHIRHRREGVAFEVQDGEGGSALAVQTALFGRFNVSNLLAVIGTLVASGIEFASAVALVMKLAPVPGRMQRAGGNGKPSVIIDYAHTPDALEQLLQAVREIANANGGRLLVLFGCGGDRDRGKRALMGAIASRLADHVVITSDNPRNESPRAIIDEILAGVTGPRTVMVDRAVAIRDAIRGAAPNDVVVLAGKGHEPYQEIAGRRYPFSDLDQARGALGEAQQC